MNLKSVALYVFIFLAGSSAQARVFDFSSNWVSAYLRSTGGVSSLNKDVYKDTSGSETAFKQGVDYSFSGELGFAFQFTESFVLRLGVEGLQPRDVMAEGRHGTTKKMDVDSSSSIFSPVAVAEYSISKSEISRFFIFAGGGFASVKANNEYTLNASGAVTYPAVPTTYKETWKAQVDTYQVGAGYEFFLLDNVTLSIDAGYRYLVVPSFEYSESLTVIRGGVPGVTNVLKGAVVRDNDGRTVALDYSGPFVGIIFKFYIPPLD